MQAVLPPATQKRCRAVLLPQGNLGAPFPAESWVLLCWGFACCHQSLHTGQRQQWSFPWQFPAETCCFWSLALSWAGTASGISWRMDPALPLGFFIHLSPPISGCTPREQLSINKHLYLEYTPLCQHLFRTKDFLPWCDWYNQLLISLSFKVHSMTNKRKSDFVFGCLLKICSFRYPNESRWLAARFLYSISLLRRKTGISPLSHLHS